MWVGKVLLRKKDPEGFIYHAYAISQFGVKDREGRYNDEGIAEMHARSFAKIKNTNGIEEDRPNGKEPLKYEQGKEPWKRSRRRHGRFDKAKDEASSRGVRPRVHGA